MVGLAGSTAIDLRSAAFTMAVTLLLIAPEAAVTVTVPRSLAVANPLVVIEATLVGVALHVTVPVMSCVLLSENVAMAVNCCTVPKGINALTGVTLIEVRVAPVTVRTAVPETVPELVVTLAVIVEVPGDTPMARP